MAVNAGNLDKVMAILTTASEALIRIGVDVDLANTFVHGSGGIESALILCVGCDTSELEKLRKVDSDKLPFDLMTLEQEGSVLTANYSYRGLVIAQSTLSTRQCDQIIVIDNVEGSLIV